MKGYTLFNALLPSLAPRLAIICAVRKPNVWVFNLNSNEEKEILLIE